ncbi:hypothetical protein [Polaromonas aquatica]|uniref:hypothetical protein n=1 Tax=Polaromonas aquatica TaxID=332657 RepID=UPI003D65FDBA
MDRTEFVTALVGVAIGVMVAAIGFPEVLEKVFIGGVVLLMVPGFVSFHFILYRLKNNHPKIYREIAATNEDLSWGMGDAFRRFRKFIHSSRARELHDGLLSAAVVVGRVTWRLSFAMAGFFLGASLALRIS